LRKGLTTLTLAIGVEMMENNNRLSGEKTDDVNNTEKKSSKMIVYPDISLKSANALVIACCAIFVALVVILTIR